MSNSTSTFPNIFSMKYLFCTTLISVVSISLIWKFLQITGAGFMNVTFTESLSGLCYVSLGCYVFVLPTPNRDKSLQINNNLLCFISVVLLLAMCFYLSFIWFPLFLQSIVISEVMGPVQYLCFVIGITFCRIIFVDQRQTSTN